MTPTERIQNNAGGVNLSGPERREIAAKLAKLERLESAPVKESEPTEILCALCGGWHAPNAESGAGGKSILDRSIACPNWTATQTRPDGRFDSYLGVHRGRYTGIPAQQPAWTPWRSDRLDEVLMDADGRAFTHPNPEWLRHFDPLADAPTAQMPAGVESPFGSLDDVRLNPKAMAQFINDNKS